MAERAKTPSDARMPIGFTIAAILAPGFMVFVFPMLDLIARNDEYFTGAYEAGKFIFLAGAVFIGLGFVLWAVSGTKVGRFLFYGYVLVAPGWVVYSLLRDTDRAIAGLVVAVALIAAALALVLSKWSPALVMGRLGLFSALLLLGTGVTTVLQMQAPPEETGDAPERPTQEAAPDEPLPNIYHVVLDEFQTEMFEIAADESTSDELSGFTWYRDARTVFGRTEMSMASIYSNTNYDSASEPKDFINQALLGPDSSLQRLRAAGYDTTGYIQVMSLYGGTSPFDEVHIATDAAAADPGSDYASLATSLWIYSNLPRGFSRDLLPARHYEQLSGNALVPDDAPPLSIQSFNSFLHREAQLAPNGRYTLVHLIVPHFPYVLEPDCGYVTGTETSPADQSRCAVKVVTDLVDELKRLDRFDSSTIIVHGDHGARYAIEGGELVSTGQDYFGEEFSDARSRSLLLVKPAGVSPDQELIVSDYPAELTDIMPTVFDASGLSLDVEDAWTSLIADDLPERPERYYHFYTPGSDDLPDREIARYVITEDGITPDGTLQLP